MNSYEFTAFTTSDLNGGNSISNGTSFTMPGAATTSFTVSDDDSTLSGDRRDNATDGYGQQAAIEGPNGAMGNGGQIYVEQYHWVSDDAGNWYVMLEIEQEGSDESYFTFLSDYGYGLPPEGANLTVSCANNVNGDWLSYDAMGAGEVAAPAEAAQTTGGEEICLMFETFDSYDLTSSPNVVSSDFSYDQGRAKTNGCDDGALEFAKVNLTDLENAKVTLDAGVLNGGFEQWGSCYGDMFRIELVTDAGVIVLDTFTGTGNTLVGSETGQVLDCGLETIAYDLPAGLGNVSLRIVSDISASSEVIALDNVKITAETPVVEVAAEPAPAPAPENVIVANNDAVTVMENEAAGDVEGNVLANDTLNDEAYAGEVATVTGDADAVGTWVEGSNGGKIKILADGSYDFDADGDFDALADGQSAETTFTYQIAEDGSVVPTQNILFVLDVSNSTVGLDGQDEFVGTGVGDVNGDGRADTVLDAQIAAAKEMIADMRAQGVDPANVNVGIVTFSGVDTSGGSAYNSATSNSQTVGTFKLDDASLDGALDGVLSGSWTNYEAGLGEAEGWFNANADASDENVLYFLSDGRPITGHDGYDYVEQDMDQFMDEVERLEADFGTSIYAVGFC